MPDCTKMNPAEIKSMAMRSAKWGIFTKILSALGIPALTILLARLLTPNDYGIIALADLVLVLLGMFQLGIGKAIIQREDLAHDAISVTFWVNALISSLLFITLLLIAPILASLLREIHLIYVFRVVAFQFLITSIGIVHNSLFEREFRFKELLWIQIWSTSVAFVAAFLMAKRGLGYWSLIIPLLGGAIIRTALLWSRSGWRPSWIIDLSLAREMLGFTAFVYLEAFLAWILVYFDKAVVGKDIGTESLGVYSLGFNIVTMIIGLPIAAASTVLLSTFSRLQTSPNELRDAYLIGTRVICTYVLPAGIGLSVIAQPLIQTLYGDKWVEMIPILGVLALYAGFGHIWVLNTEAFKAIGHPEIMARIYIPVTLIMIPTFIISVQYGLLAFTIARSMVVLVGAIPHTYYAIKALNLPRNYLWKCCRSPFIASFLMGGILYCTQFWVRNHLYFLEGNFIYLAGLIITGIILYIGFLRLFEPTILQKIKSLIMETLNVNT